MNTDIIIICRSFYHGNTEKIALAIARKLNCAVVNCETALDMDLSSYKIIGLGSGIYFTSHHPMLSQLAVKLNSTQKVFLFSTHGSPFLGRYHLPLKTALAENGVAVIGEFSCRGYDCTGPYILVGGGNKGKPNEADQSRAARFVSRLLPEYCKDSDTVHNGGHVEIRPDECIGCGACEEICPMRVFCMEDKHPVVVRDEDCIHCSLCRERCPAGAISVQHNWKEAIGIARRHAKRRQL